MNKTISIPEASLCDRAIYQSHIRQLKTGALGEYVIRGNLRWFDRHNKPQDQSEVDLLVKLIRDYFHTRPVGSKSKPNPFLE